MKFRSALAAAVACVAVAGCGGDHITKAPTTSTVAPTAQSATGSVHPAGWGQTPPPASLLKAAPTATPTGTMFDAVTWQNIPRDPFAVAGYPFGRYITWGPILSNFPGAHHVSIAVAFLEHAMCGDFEPGDMASSQAGQWALNDMKSFPRPCEYGDGSNMPAIAASDRAWLGPNWRNRVFLWLAWYHNVPGLVSGFDAVQYTDTCLGRGLDCSTVSLAFLSIAQPPYVPAPVLPLCFSRRESAAACAAVKVKIASWQRAAESTIRGYDARGCLTLWNREQWFATRVNKPPASKRAYRKAAEAATLHAYQARGCVVLNQRYWWFEGQIDNARIAN